MFKYLDKDEKGYITYQDFTEVTEERRRHLVPSYPKNPKKSPYDEIDQNYLTAYL